MYARRSRNADNNNMKWSFCCDESIPLRSASI
jgi:hypothetical protein